MATPQTVCAETTATLVKPSPLNPLRRLFRKPVPTYTTHLFADAVVAPVPQDDGREAPLPTLSIETKADGRAYVVLNWSTPAGGTVSRVSVRERGANRPWRDAGLVQLHPRPPKDAVREAVTVSSLDAFGGVSAQAALDTSPVALFWDGGTLKAVPSEAPPPTESTTVLHDLAFIADQLELAQYQVALSPGGPDAGSVDNAACVALRAVHVVQAKLEVVADAADMAAAEAVGTLARLHEQAEKPTHAIQAVNRCRSSLRFVTDRLPHTPKESAHVSR